MILISVTKKGDKIGQELKKSFNQLEVITREEVVVLGLQEVTWRAVENHQTIVFISSVGIAVRAIAPWVKDKTKDPAVIVIDAQAQYVISLLSGHLGGANDMTNRIASYLEALPIITTATDHLGVIAPDLISKQHKLEIESMEKCKAISVKLIEGEKVAFIDEDDVIPMPAGYVEEDEDTYNVVVTNQAHVENAFLKLIRKNIVLGIGCRKNIDSTTMRKYILSQLKALNIHPLAVKLIVSIDIKKQEPCIVELANYLQVPFKVYSKDEINGVEEAYEGSDFVKSQVGVRGVSEPCVILTGAQVIQEKKKHEGMTLCVGKLPS